MIEQALSKPIPGRIRLALFEGVWGIEDEISYDVQTFDTYEAAREAYERIVDRDSMVREFGWKF